MTDSEDKTYFLNLMLNPIKLYQTSRFIFHLLLCQAPQSQGCTHHCIALWAPHHVLQVLLRYCQLNRWYTAPDISCSRTIYCLYYCYKVPSPQPYLQLHTIFCLTSKQAVTLPLCILLTLFCSNTKGLEFTLLKGKKEKWKQPVSIYSLFTPTICKMVQPYKI